MSRVFWNVTQCSLVEAYKAFRGVVLTPSSESNKSPATKKKLDACLTNHSILKMVAVHYGELSKKFYQDNTTAHPYHHNITTAFHSE
jgi:hypothetical protein